MRGELRPIAMVLLEVDLPGPAKYAILDLTTYIASNLLVYWFKQLTQPSVST